MELIEEAQRVYSENFPAETRFERAIFFSWGCMIGDCSFCYMSTQPKDKPPKQTKRSISSILTEAILAKELGWDIGFFTGGIGVFTPDELEFLLKSIKEITNEKIWLSIGPVSKPLLQRYQPYIKGVVGSTETINPELHKKVCPSKPLAPYERMFLDAKELNLKRAMTFIVGMGETKEDLPLLINFINKYGIDKIHVYGLIPQKNTPFENSSSPTKEDQAWWIAKIRTTFPKIDIQCGIWEDRVERTSYLLKAGANSISKFKATKLFGTDIAKDIENQAKLANRKFIGTLTKIPSVNWEEKVNSLPFNEDLKSEIKHNLTLYLDKMEKNLLVS